MTRCRSNQRLREPTIAMNSVNDARSQDAMIMLKKFELKIISSNARQSKVALKSGRAILDCRIGDISTEIKAMRLIRVPPRIESAGRTPDSVEQDVAAEDLAEQDAHHRCGLRRRIAAAPARSDLMS